MSKKIAIVTDSTCDLPEEYRDKYDITVLPLTIIFGEEQLLDGVDISAEAFYERLVSDPVHPTTSQPTPNDVLQVFKAARDKGAEAVFCILISSAMCGHVCLGGTGSQRLAHTGGDVRQPQQFDGFGMAGDGGSPRARGRGRAGRDARRSREGAR